MGKSSAVIYNASKQQYPSTLKLFCFFIPLSLAITSFLFIFIYIYATSKLSIDPQSSPFLEPPTNYSLLDLIIPGPTDNETIPFSIDNTAEDLFFDLPRTSSYAKQIKWSLGDLFGFTGKKLNQSYLTGVERSLIVIEDFNPTQTLDLLRWNGSKPVWFLFWSGTTMNNTEIYHDTNVFLEDYKEMNKSFKIFVYPHKPNDPFANVLLPEDYNPKGPYTSELYFKKALFDSHFITKDPNEAHLFYMPFSILDLRHDPRIGPEKLQDFVKDYIFNISHKYPFWNRTGGADHFYTACHSISQIAMDKTVEAKENSIQLVCTSTYFVTGYFPHKDVSLPQIWVKKHDPKTLVSSKRNRLAFFAGRVNSPVRAALFKHWVNDTEIFAHFGGVETDDGKEQLRSKFCLHVKGFEINTARVTDALHYGCVPVILANHHDFPFSDILNWKSFSVVVHYMDIPVLRKILQGISSEELSWLQSNAMKVRKHFEWNVPAVDYDAFYMTMYELWLRKSSVRVRLTASKEFI